MHSRDLISPPPIQSELLSLEFMLQPPPRELTVEYPTEIMGTSMALLRTSLTARNWQELRAKTRR